MKRPFCGQEEILEEFQKRKDQNTLPHCLLITGPQGVGKAQLAKDLAKIYLEKTKDDQTEDLLKKGNHPDFYRVSSQGESIKKQEVVDLIEEAQQTSYYGGSQIFLIEGADQLTSQGQNALLKTLEEPQNQVAIFLTAVHEGQVLETLVSRARKIPLHPVKEKYLTQWLLDQGYGSNPYLKEAVALSGGCPAKALDYLKDGDWLHLRNELFQKLQNFRRKSLDYPFVLKDFFLDHKDQLKDLLLLMNQYYRDVLVYQKIGDSQVLYHKDKVPMMEGENLKNSSLYTIIKDIQESGDFLEKNGNTRLVIEGLLIKIQEEYL